MRAERMKASQAAPQATYQGLPLIGQKAAVDSKQQFIAELNRRFQIVVTSLGELNCRFQALEVRCGSLEKSRVEHSRAIGLLAVEIGELQNRQKVVRNPKKASNVQPGVRGR